VTVQRVPDGSLTVAGSTSAQDVDVSWSRTIKFNNRQTKQIYDAALVGATGVIAGLCTIAAPSIVDPFCGVIAGLLAAIVRGFSAPGDNDCLGITVTTRLGIPPVSVRAGYVNCT
jgi:ammonia channel protein AmtB